jgi:UDP-N-acetyl-D-mannosaminuronic acid transferase (WecB/TagA/CpsF family)
MSNVETETGNFRTILGVRFFAGTAPEAVQLGLRGGLVVAPSAPVLVTMAEEAGTRAALQRSRLALTDSGLMVLLWNLLQRDRVVRVSGLEYLVRLLEEPELREPGAMFWIMPHEKALARCLAWLRERGYPVGREQFYLAPLYPAGELRDEALLGAIAPGIHCIGAAIGFLSGDQVHIPMWADRWRLGWLFRFLSAPLQFAPRYWKARRLVGLMLRYGAQAPGQIQ